ncbi:MAG: 50S ribosomal protein L11 methyltransferase [Clostridia bacterium]|nr:50S ribosomal protein L11 methyltransferase [Clostridia bacterium]
MDYRELTISLPREKVDLVSTFLITGGYDTFEISDLSDLMENAGEVFADYVEDDLLARRNEPPVIRFYFAADEDKKAAEVEQFVLGVAAQLGWDDVSCETRLVQNSDWDTRWKQYFYSFPVGEKLFIRPAWEEPGPREAGRKVICIDPAAAFGTGTHATTRLCLEAMEKALRPGDRVLDMGCGSGILGIGAALLGASFVYSVDIDEVAVRVARENFGKNGVACETGFLCADVLSDEKAREKMGGGYDLICANIVAGVISAMAPVLFAALKPGGVMLSSGILSSRREEVTAALTAAGFTVEKETSDEDWICLVLKKGA